MTEEQKAAVAKVETLLARRADRIRDRDHAVAAVCERSIRDRIASRLEAIEAVKRDTAELETIADRVAKNAELCGHTSIVGDVSAVRRTVRQLKRKAEKVRARLAERVTQQEG